MSLAWYQRIFGVEPPILQPEGFNISHQPGYVQGSGRLYTGTNAPVATGNTVVGIVYYTAIEVSRQITVDALVFNVSTLSAGNAILGVYTSDTNGLPNQLIAQTGQVSTLTAGIKTATLIGGNITLIPGWYYIASVFSISTGVTGGASSTPVHLVGHFTFPTGNTGQYSGTLAFGTLPQVAAIPNAVSAISVTVALRLI
jgi:hypothetical protein